MCVRVLAYSQASSLDNSLSFTARWLINVIFFILTHRGLHATSKAAYNLSHFSSFIVMF